MSGQALDLRGAAQIVRRRKLLVTIVAGLGIILGIAYAVLKPPMLESSALVVLSPSTNSTATQVIIASSDPVLEGALPSAYPGATLKSLQSRVQVKRLTSNLLSFDAQGTTSTQAEGTANAVSKSYIAYVTAAGSPAGRVQAQILQPANTATGTALPVRLAEAGVVGGLAGALLGILIALIISRNDRRLRERDEIADSIGVPVLASVPVDHPADAAGWTRLLEEYEPGVVDAWRLRKALHQLRSANPGDASAGGASSIAVLSLSSDRNALALGPQLAVFAASLGISTALVVDPQQDTNVSATLHAACAAPPSPGRSANLMVSVSGHNDIDRMPGAVLTIVVAAVDGQAPRVADTTRTAVTLLGVTAGTATAEELARVAANAAADGRDIAGLLVADPDSADHTTGRMPQLARPGQHRMPRRMTGSATETRL